MNRRRSSFLAGLVLAAGSALSVAPATPAFAANVDRFDQCVPFSTTVCVSAYTGGTITWYNRTANVQGEVVDRSISATRVTFKAFAGGLQIGPAQTRTADNEYRPFNFPMGDSGLVGGINWITVQVCAAGYGCSDEVAYWKQ